MKKMMALVMALAVLLTVTLAAAETAPSAQELNYAEKVVCMGNGIFGIEFMRDVAWRTDYVLTVKDENDVPLTAHTLGGDADEVYVQVDGDMLADGLYTFSFVAADGVIRAVGQNTPGFSYANHCEYCLTFGHDEMACADRQAAGIRQDVDRCNFCGGLDHDDDRCPQRPSGVRYCDECAKTGHDDDACPYDDGDDDGYGRCSRCGQRGHGSGECLTSAGVSVTVGQTVQPIQTAPTARPAQAAASATARPEYCDDCREYGHDDDECPYEWCERCGERGHDDDRCPDRTCKRCGEKGHSSDDCPMKRCDECGEYGHDDDRCPNERCDECGKYGHDDDDCPNERCDECGKYGHDDDDCPNERCDECGKYGHDDDDCPNERHSGKHGRRDDD